MKPEILISIINIQPKNCYDNLSIYENVFLVLPFSPGFKISVISPPDAQKLGSRYGVLANKHTKLSCKL